VAQKFGTILLRLNFIDALDERRQKCKQWVVWGLEVTQGHQQHNHLIERIRLPIGV